MDLSLTGKMIAQSRQKKGWTQKQLADKINLSDKAVSKWERGLSFPDISVLPKISDILDLPIQNLVTGQPLDSPNPEISQAVKSTVELSNKELKRKSKRFKTLLTIIIALSIIVVIVMSICFGIAFTPADSYTTKKQDSITAQSVTSELSYSLPIRGRVSAWPAKEQYVKTKKNMKYIRTLVEQTVEANGDTYEHLDYGNILIKHQNTDGTVDMFYFYASGYQKNYTVYCLSGMEHTIVVYNEMSENASSQAYNILFPTFMQKDKTMFFSQSLDYEFGLPFSSYNFTTHEQFFYDSVNELCNFYENSGYFNIVRDGFNQVEIHPLFSNGNAFKIEFEYKPDALAKVFRVFILE